MSLVSIPVVLMTANLINKGWFTTEDDPSDAVLRGKLDNAMEQNMMRLFHGYAHPLVWMQGWGQLHNGNPAGPIRYIEPDKGSVVIEIT